MKIIRKDEHSTMKGETFTGPWTPIKGVLMLVAFGILFFVIQKWPLPS